MRRGGCAWAGVFNLHERDADHTEAAPDEEDLGAKVCVAGAGVHHIWSGVGYGPVQKPIAGGCHAEATGAGFQWEDLASHYPGARALRRCVSQGNSKPTGQIRCLPKNTRRRRYKCTRTQSKPGCWCGR